MTVADQIATFLAEKGIDHAYGIIGAGNLSIWDAIARKKKTALICCHGEAAAVTAAGFHYRICRRLAVALVTTGAGSSNAITGALAAYMDSTPVLIISGNEPSKYHKTGNRGSRILGVQGYSTAHTAQHFVKRSFHCDTPEYIAALLRESCALALSPRQGPCWLDFPRDTQAQNAVV